MLGNKKANELVESIDELKGQLSLIQKECRHSSMERNNIGEIKIHEFCPDCGFDHTYVDQ